MDTYVISAFPGCGKTVAFFDLKDTIKVKDSDSSTFDKSEFPENYIASIKEDIGNYDIIFVSSHKEVRDKLEEEKIPYILFFPSESRRGEFLENYIRRKSPPKLIQKIDNNFNKWIDEIKREESEISTRIMLGEKGQFITNEQHFVDLVNHILNKKKEEQKK